MSEWRLRHSAATSTPSGRGFILYTEVSSPSSVSTTLPLRYRCTCLSEVGNTPLAAVEHVDVAAAIVCDFLDDERKLSSWMCIVHKDEHLDSIGRPAIGRDASILTSYPIGEAGDASPRICPLYGINARSARPGATGCYIFGTPPSSWKVPLPARAQSVTGQWVGQPIIPITGTAMTFSHISHHEHRQHRDAQSSASVNPNPHGSGAAPQFLDLMSTSEDIPASTSTSPHASEARAFNVASSTASLPQHHSHHHHHHHHHHSHQHLQQYPVPPHNTYYSVSSSATALIDHHHHHPCSNTNVPVHAWCLLTPYTLVPIFVCGTVASCSSSALEGSVLLEFAIQGGVTIVVFMTTHNVILLFAVECAAGGDALIWHVIPGECHQFVGDDAILMMSVAHGTRSAPLVCDEVQCEAIASKDPLRCILALQFPRSQSVVVLETPPLRTESSFFPLDQGLSHHQPQQMNDTTSQNNNHRSTTRGPSHQPHLGQQLHGSDFASANHRSGNNNNNPNPTTTVSSRSASQLTAASSSVAASSAVSAVSHHPSVSPQRCEFCLLERFSSASSTFALFKWSPVSAGASFSSFSMSCAFFVPFFGLIEQPRQDSRMAQQQQQQQQETPSTSLTTATVSIFARGAFPGRIEKIASFESCFTSSNIDKTNSQREIDAAHVCQSCPLVGSYLMVRDKISSCWYIDRRLPILRTNSVEFMTVCTLMSVLPQHAEDLYRHLVQDKLEIFNLNTSTKKLCCSYFDSIQNFLARSGSTPATAHCTPTLRLFSPWSVVGEHNNNNNNNNNSNNSNNNSNKSKNSQVPSSSSASFCRRSSSSATSTTIDPTSLQVATVSLHLLAESLKVDRLYLQQLQRLSSLILSLADSCGLKHYSRYYRELEPSPPSSNSGMKETNADGVFNEEIDSQLLAITLRQFFDGIPLSTSATAATFSFDFTVPLDLISSLRWMAEGQEPFIRQWPLLTNYSIDDPSSRHQQNHQDGTSIFSTLLRQRDPFRHASDVFNFVAFVTNNASSNGSSNTNNNNNNNNFFGNSNTHFYSLASNSCSSSPTAIIERAVGLGWNSNFLETRLPLGVAHFVYQAIAICSDELSASDQMMWKPEAVDLIGRHDILLAALNHNTSTTSALGFGGPAQQRQRQRLLARAVPVERTVQREAVLFSESLSRHIEACASGSSLAQVIETEAPVGPFSQVKTERIHQLLSATSPIPLPANIDPTEAVSAVLPLLVRRAVAVAVGRGMLGLATHNFRERDRVPVPPLVLSGLTADGLVINCEARMISPEVMKWPTFHNACAAALRFLPLIGNSRSAKQAAAASPIISRHWIVHQARDTQHRAGVLLAIGLLGHLSQLQLTDIYSIFVAPSAQDPQREPLAIAMLLGLGSSFRRSRSEAVFRCLAVHIHSLTPNGEDVEVSLDTQSAALIALGLVFEGAGQSFLVDMLLNDMSRMPSDQINKQREGYSLASGIALGLMLLGHGRNHNLAHLGIEERLLAFLEGGKREHVRPHLFRPDSVYSDVTESVAYASGDEKFLTRALVAQARVDVVDPCNTVSEGKTFNTLITGPAATIALGLMFMKTRDEWIAKHLDLPSTLPLLDAVTPHLSMLRVLCAGLIRWQTDHPPKDLLGASYLPQCLRNLIPQLKGNVSLRELDIQAQYRSLHLGYAHAGAALAVGMTFAGTLIASVKSLLLAALEGFANGDIGATGVPQPMIQKKSHSYDPCLASTAIAVALVSAGTGDADVLAVLTAVLKRGNFTYGTYMAISSAIGLLFLGGGRCTLSNSVQSVAALLLAFYPQWPQTAGDNTFHLQALRHFYALSAVPRWLSTFDVESGRVVTTSARLVMNTTLRGVGLDVSLARPDRDVSELARLWTPIPSEKIRQQQRSKNSTKWNRGVFHYNNNNNANFGLEDDDDQGDDDHDGEGHDREVDVDDEAVKSNDLDNSTSSVHNLNVAGKKSNKMAGTASLPVVTPCLLPEISNIDRVEIREPGYFNLTIWNQAASSSSLLLLASRSSSLGVKKKPHFFFGNLPRVFGPHSFDAAIRDALIVYSCNSKVFKSSSSTVICLQDLGLLLLSPSSSAAPTSSSHHRSLLQRLSQTFNRCFIKPLVGDPKNVRAICEVVKQRHDSPCSDVSLTQLLVENGGIVGPSDSTWLNHSLHYSGLNFWWNERIQALSKMISASNVGDNGDTSSLTTILIDAAESGKFGIEVAATIGTL